MRVLIITSRFPYPAWRGNQVRTAEWLEALADHERLLVCPSPRSSDETGSPVPRDVVTRHYRNSVAGRILGMLASLGRGRPIQEGFSTGRRARSTLETLVRSHPPDVAVVQMVRCGWALDVLERSSPETPVLFDAIDAMGLHYQRAARFVAPLLRPVYQMEAGRCRRREQELARRSRLTTAVSQRDLEAVGGAVGRVVPVAGRRIGDSRRNPERSEVLLSGNLGYRPTVRGALWFAREVWPEIRRRVSGARWVLAGARPARAIRRLGALDGVEIHGDVPDLAPFQARATVSIAPMSEGSGVPMKVLEAWAAGVPVVAHPWTADGLEDAARDGLAVVEDPGEWVDAIVELLTDPEARDRLAARGSTSWRRCYSPERIAELVREVVCGAAES